MKALRRIFWLSIMVLGLAWPIQRGIADVREQKAYRQLLLEVQAALQNYHVDQERYIPRETLAGAEVIGVLSDFGFLEPLPHNPWTGQSWTLAEGETDFLRYRSDPNFETYALYIVSPNTGETIMELDSVSATSLPSTSP